MILNVGMLNLTSLLSDLELTPTGDRQCCFSVIQGDGDL